MAKAGRPKSPIKTELVHLRLPEAVANALRKGPLGLSGEVRARLTQSVEHETSLNRDARELLEAIGWIVSEIEQQTGSVWTLTTSSREAVMAGVRAWIEVLYPPQPRGAADDLLGVDDPATVGRTIARSHVRVREHMSGRRKDTAGIKAKGAKNV